MSEYANKLSNIAEKKQKLIAEEMKLIEKRKKEIGQLAEKFELLTLPDSVVTGLFHEAQSALKNKSDKIKTWQSSGEQFLKSKSNAKATQARST
jgi:hypothetical protein